MPFLASSGGVDLFPSCCDGNNHVRLVKAWNSTTWLVGGQNRRDTGQNSIPPRPYPQNKDIHVVPRPASKAWRDGICDIHDTFT